MPPKFKRHVSEEDLLNAHNAETTELLGGDPSDEEEDFFLQGPRRWRGGGGGGGAATHGVRFKDGKLMKIAAEVRLVEGAMQENVERLVDRGERISELHDRSEAMNDAADAFATSAAALRRTTWVQKNKAKLIAFLVVLLVLLLIFVPVFVRQARK